MPYEKDIAKIKAAIERGGYTLENVATAACLKPTYLSRLLDGEENPNSRMLIAIANVLGIETDIECRIRRE